MQLVNGIHSNVVSALDRGFQFGDGVFETLRCIDGRLLYWSRHFERLAEGCARLGIEIPDESVFLADIEQLAGADDSCVIKLIVTRGQSERGYAEPARVRPTRVLMRSELPGYPDSYASDGVEAEFCEHPLSLNPALAGIKHLNRLDNVLARRSLARHCQEGIMRDPAGNVIEGIMSNLFIVREGDLVTPSLSSCGVAGITRQVVLEIAAGEGISTLTATLGHDDILAADEIFFTNSLIGIWPCRRIGDRNLTERTVTRRLQELLKTQEEMHVTALG